MVAANFVSNAIHRKRSGAVLIISMIFVLLFSALAVSMVSLTGSNLQIASNQHKTNTALSAALSGVECAKHLVNTVALQSTNTNIVSLAQANETWLDLCQHVQTSSLDGKVVSSPSRFSDTFGQGDEITIPSMNLDSNSTAFTLRFYRHDNDANIIKILSTGVDSEVSRMVSLDMVIAKDSEVMEYAIASRGRMWLTGDSNIHGDIFSSWDRVEISPFNITSDSSVLGTINTVLGKEEIGEQDYQLETLDADGNPIFDGDGNRVYSVEDEIQGYHDGVNYEQESDDMPGMDIDDYDTDCYNQCLSDIVSCPEGQREVEYFPHASGNYNLPRDGTPSSTWNRELTRHVYENQTFTDVKLPDDRNALFRNCTFEGVLYIDCNKSGSSSYNNVRFENCQYNGAIVTDVPQTFQWRHNCLYFTGAATFENDSDVPATILAPHFNVNLGNNNPETEDNNILTGAIIGGIVDVRGNAQVFGTIISMCDTTQWSSGYVTNIGATLGDGGSETTEPGDIGTIDITPDFDKMLPSGITTPIVIKFMQNTYSECM